MQTLPSAAGRLRAGLARPGLAIQILALTGLLLVALTLGINYVTLRQIHATTRDQAKSDALASTNFLKYLADDKGTARIVEGKLQFGGWIANSNHSIVDAVKNNTQAEATMFQLIDGEMVSVATTITNPDGTRATGTILQGSPAAAAKRGESYTGEGPLLGQSYYTSYLLINDIAGRPAGILFTGKPLAQIDALEARVTRTIFALSAVGLLVGLALLFALVNRLMIRPLGELRTAAVRIGAGDYAVRVPVRGGGELGQVATTVNGMVDRITEGARAQAEQNAAMQRQIVQLLDEVSSVAEGDLTVEAEVSADALGAVADSFNYMITELRAVIGRVNAATQQVATSADQILGTTDSLNRSAEQQAARIADTSTAVEEMAVSIQQVSENAAVSAQVAREARAAAETGAQAVTATVAGMGRIRGQVQETAKKIKRLGESSQEIGQAVQLIEEIARRTNRLALNAAIQAAMAGEHGKGFAVVAEEVGRLAERTGAATGQIAELVGAIQSETAQAVVAMEDGTREVVTGSRLADDAGRSLQAIDQIVGQLAELIEAISLAADQQARASSGIARAMGELSSVTQHTASDTQQAAGSVATLATLATDLRASVAAFRLEATRADAATNGHGHANGHADRHADAEALLVPAGGGRGANLN